ncbi:DEAD/DEAH box helicase family protein [Thermaerobacter sp. PB12/4term]|nr:DEAD/DEAH box helicase family protein [Thermaerobacter sp. PB12/4term]
MLDALSDLVDTAPPVIARRGRDYAAGGQVLEVGWEPGPRLVGRVQGTAAEPYRVAIWWDPAMEDWQAACSCPYDDTPCKHAVAVAIDVLTTWSRLREAGTTAGPEEGPDEPAPEGPAHGLAPAAGSSPAAAPPGPATGQRAPGTGQGAPAPGWREAMERWTRPAGSGGTRVAGSHPARHPLPRPGTDQVVVRVYFYPGGPRLAIHRARWGRQGLGKERPLSFDPFSPWGPSPAGPLHRLLFRLVEQAGPHSRRPAPAGYDPLYELPPGMVDLGFEILGRLPFVFAGDGSEPLRIEHEPYRVELLVAPAGSGGDLTLTTLWSTPTGQPWSPPAGSIGIPGERYLWVQWGPVVRPVLPEGDVALHLAVGARPLVIPAAEVAEFVGHYLPRLQQQARVRLPRLLEERIRDGTPRPVVLLSESEGALVVELAFAYAPGGPTVRVQDEEPVLIEGEAGFRSGRKEPPVWYRRRRDLEQAAWDEFAALMAAARARPDAAGRCLLFADSALDFLTQTLPRLATRWEVRGQERLVRFRVGRGPLRSRVQVRTGIDWLDLDVALEGPDGAAGIDALLDALARGSRYVRLDTGVLARLPEAWLERLDTLAALAPRRRKTQRPSAGKGQGSPLPEPLRLSRWAFGLAAQILEGADEAEADEGYRRLSRLLDGFRRIPAVPLPRGLKARLRPYQILGYHWLAFLRDHGLHGILADDMGLGKTLQVLALLLAEKEAGRAAAPSLVVVPTSLVHNWVEEARRFAPSLDVLALAGPRRSTLFRQAGRYDLLITTYPLVWRDAERLLERDYHYLILDEAQHVKNPETQSWRTLRQVKARHRLALTGTPVENHVLDLWALFEILLPGYLGPRDAFLRRYGGAEVEPGPAAAPRAAPAPAEGRLVPAGEADPRVVELRRRIHPFILRRLKDQVARDLPPRTEVVQYCEMAPAQRRLYRELLLAYRTRVQDEVDRVGIARSRMTILEALLRLRQACCHPALLDLPAYRKAGSAKLEAFRELVEHAVGGGGRVLVFSQFARMLDILGQELDRMAIPWERLDGRTRNRAARIERFQAGQVPVFLISLKAGGTGLNLTTASYVIHFDPWWNPAAEEQATGRAHRIGQDRPVFSYKLITRGTVEEKILQLQARKQALAGALLAGDGKLGKDLTREDLEFLLAPD